MTDPAGYLARLRELTGPDAWIVAEKILAADEPLCRNWAVAGTTGYDALNVINGLFIDQRNAEAFSRLYQRFKNLQIMYARIRIFIISF